MSTIQQLFKCWIMYLHTAQQTPPQQSKPDVVAVRGSHGDEWREMFDPKSGRKYWINRDSKQMSFTPPQAAPSEVASSAGGIGAPHVPVLPRPPARRCAREPASTARAAPVQLLLRLH